MPGALPVGVSRPGGSTHGLMVPELCAGTVTATCLQRVMWGWDHARAAPLCTKISAKPLL